MSCSVRRWSQAAHSFEESVQAPLYWWGVARK
jgi:hypothetical protein